MSLKDKLEIGLKPDAPYRPDNLPEFQQDDPACEVASTPGTEHQRAAIIDTARGLYLAADRSPLHVESARAIKGRVALNRLTSPKLAARMRVHPRASAP